MSRVIDQELIAGRINVQHAKALLAINRDIVIDLELRHERNGIKRFAHTTGDWDRSNKLDAYFCVREARRSNKKGR